MFAVVGACRLIGSLDYHSGGVWLTQTTLQVHALPIGMYALSFGLGFGSQRAILTRQQLRGLVAVCAHLCVKKDSRTSTRKVFSHYLLSSELACSRLQQQTQEAILRNMTAQDNCQ